MCCCHGDRELSGGPSVAVAAARLCRTSHICLWCRHTEGTRLWGRHSDTSLSVSCTTSPGKEKRNPTLAFLLVFATTGGSSRLQTSPDFLPDTRDPGENTFYHHVVSERRPPSHRHRKIGVGKAICQKRWRAPVERERTGADRDILIWRFHFQFNLIMHPALQFNYLTSGF